MKKRLGLVILIVAVALIVGLLVWRFWPRSFTSVMPGSGDNITSFSVYGMFHLGEGHTETYSIHNIETITDDPREIIEILDTAKYQPDFRNLLPWGLEAVSADKNFDGRTVTVNLCFQDGESKYIELQFLSNSIVLVRTSYETNISIYHPANSVIFDKLVEYLETHGILIYEE